MAQSQKKAQKMGMICPIGIDCITGGAEKKCPPKLSCCNFLHQSFCIFSNERSPSPSSRESNRKSLKDRKSSNKDFETEEDNDKTSNSGRSKRASSRKDKTNT